MEKDYNGSERRRFKRIVFSAKDEVMGLFAFPGFVDDLGSYKIADVSAGGLRFILPRDDAFQIAVNDTLLLREIKGKSELALAAAIELEVKWIMDHEMLEHVMIGCEFIDISQTDQTQIDQFVKFELARQDQDS